MRNGYNPNGMFFHWATEEGRQAIADILPMLDEADAAGDFIIYSVSHIDDGEHGPNGYLDVGVTLPDQPMSFPKNPTPGLSLMIHEGALHYSHQRFPPPITPPQIARVALTVLKAVRVNPSPEHRDGWSLDWAQQAGQAARELAGQMKLEQA